LKKFIKTKDVVDYHKYEDIRHEVRKNTWQLNKDEQNIAKNCKSNRKNYGNYINSNTRCQNKIDDLSYTNDQGVDSVVSNDLDKANVVSNYF